MSVIEELIAILQDRKANPTPESYTAHLLAQPDKIAQKVGEEAVEVIVAALAQTPERLIEESADLVYHLLVLLTAHDVTWADVMAELAQRRK